MKCADCKFYEEKDGECHRYPPTKSGWPTADDDDFCGEFVAKVRVSSGVVGVNSRNEGYDVTTKITDLQAEPPAPAEHIYQRTRSDYRECQRCARSESLVPRIGEQAAWVVVSRGLAAACNPLPADPV